MSDELFKRTIAVVTGTRAEYGLLRPVMRAIESHDDLRLRTIVTGCHLLGPENTAEEVRSEFQVYESVPMQSSTETGRAADAVALGHGVAGLANVFSELSPDVVLVLGDRIEAFAAASAASVMGIRVAHLHGGDRAQGIADEAMRHAITKLAHIHFAATATSAERILAMGEPPTAIHVVGSPAIDDLASFTPLARARFDELGEPEIVFLMHPCGCTTTEESGQTTSILSGCARVGRVLAIHPNHDPGREGVLQGIHQAGCPVLPNAPRREFIGLLRRAKCLIGNSSAGLIECAALPTWCINIGSRQSGRERAGNVIDLQLPTPQALDAALAEAIAGAPPSSDHPFGDGRTGIRTAELLASFSPTDHPIRKRITL